MRAVKPIVLLSGLCGCLSVCSSTREQRSASPPDTTHAPSDSAAVEFYPAARLAQITSELARRADPGQTFGGHSQFHYVESRRVDSGSPEIHDHWIDVTFVQAGRATLLTGGRVDGSRLVSAGEHRGGRIMGGTSRAIAAGDLFVIPVGVPHQFQVMRGDSIVYLTIKIAGDAESH
jgi:mannose-6-phosphate isomerase-like protein (cupin superfamily)